MTLNSNEMRDISRLLHISTLTVVGELKTCSTRSGESRAVETAPTKASSGGNQAGRGR
jgi:dTDP-D-glucose 4,6-dehydratase